MRGDNPIIDVGANVGRDTAYVRAARNDELEKLRALERAAGSIFREVGMNAIADAPHVTPGLRRLRAQEAAGGLDRWPRVVMQRSLAR